MQARPAKGGCGRLQVLFAFGSTGQNDADVNGDQLVDDADLLIVLFNFGTGC